MNTSWFQSLVMGFVSGLAELLPISAEAHRGLLCNMYGIESESAILTFAIHLACLIALLRVNREEIEHLQRTNQLMKIPARRRKSAPDQNAVCTIRLLRTAAMLTVLGRLFQGQTAFIASSTGLLAISFLINGFILYIPRFLRSGNMVASNMPRLDGMLMGIGAGLSVIPGISLTGASASIGIARGADRKFGFQFACLLLMPGLVIDLVWDMIGIAGQGVGLSGGVLLGALLGAVGAGAGLWLAFQLMNRLAKSTGFTRFAYYCWGVAMLSFMLFLMI